jgi:hypothetical protein
LRRNLAVGPEGALYIAEAGRGRGSETAAVCVPGEFGEDTCYGPTGAVTRVWGGKQERIVAGLSSFANISDNSFAVGPHGVSFSDGPDVYLVVGACFDPVGVEAGCGQLLRLAAESGQWQTVADLTTFELSENPDGARVESNPYAVLALPTARIVADAAGNDLLYVDKKGNIATLAVFPTRPVEFPPGSGDLVAMDAVPTSVARGPDEAFYVGQLTGFPFPVGEARVYRVVTGQQPAVYLNGFTHITDLEFDEEGNLYVLQISSLSLLEVFSGGSRTTGAVIRVKPDGARQTLLEGLTMPGGIALDAEGDAIYVTLGSVCAGEGEVIRLELADDEDD